MLCGVYTAILEAKAAAQNTEEISYGTQPSFSGLLGLCCIATEWVDRSCGNDGAASMIDCRRTRNFGYMRLDGLNSVATPSASLLRSDSLSESSVVSVSISTVLRHPIGFNYYAQYVESLGGSDDRKIEVRGHCS